MQKCYKIINKTLNSIMKIKKNLQFNLFEEKFK